MIKKLLEEPADVVRRSFSPFSLLALVLLQQGLNQIKPKHSREGFFQRGTREISRVLIWDPLRKSKENTRQKLSKKGKLKHLVFPVVLVQFFSETGPLSLILACSFLLDCKANFTQSNLRLSFATIVRFHSAAIASSPRRISPSLFLSIRSHLSFAGFVSFE